MKHIWVFSMSFEALEVDSEVSGLKNMIKEVGSQRSQPLGANERNWGKIKVKK